MRSHRLLLIPLLGCLVFAGSLPLHAQGRAYSPDQINQMVAPIALYPDALMSQVLMASTYPNQVTETDQWVRANPGLSGGTLDSALATATWDPSVIALAKFPTVLDRMAQNITWTTDLGNAFLYQRDDVMDAVQSLRSAAYQNGTLRTNEQERVVTEGPNIVIQPSTPEVIYVPTYQPAVVFGSYWNYPSYYYPGVWNPWPGYSFVNGFAWGLGYLFGNILFGGCDWGHHDVWINNSVINSCGIYHNSPYYHDNHWGGGYGHQSWERHPGGVDYARGGTGAPYGGRNYDRINGIGRMNGDRGGRIEPAAIRANRGDGAPSGDGTRQRDMTGTRTRDNGRTAQRDMTSNTPRDLNRNGQRAPIDSPVRGAGRPTMGDSRINTPRGSVRQPVDPATFPTRGLDRQGAHGPTSYAGGYAGQGYDRPTQRGQMGSAPRDLNRPTVNSPRTTSERGYNRPSANSTPGYSARSVNRPSMQPQTGYSRSGNNQSYARPEGRSARTTPPSARGSAPSGHGGSRQAAPAPRGGQRAQHNR